MHFLLKENGLLISMDGMPEAESFTLPYGTIEILGFRQRFQAYLTSRGDIEQNREKAEWKLAIFSKAIPYQYREKVTKLFPSNLSPKGLLMRPFHFYLPENEETYKYHYIHTRVRGLEPRDHLIEKEPNMVSLSLSRDNEFTSIKKVFEFPTIVFVIDPEYVKANLSRFHLTGSGFQNPNTREEYSHGLELLGLGQHPFEVIRYKDTDIKLFTGFDEVVVEGSIPAEGIRAIFAPRFLAEGISKWDLEYELDRLPIYVINADKIPVELSLFPSNSLKDEGLDEVEQIRYAL